MAAIVTRVYAGLQTHRFATMSDPIFNSPAIGVRAFALHRPRPGLFALHAFGYAAVLVSSFFGA
jgi:hypothetical protein